MDNAPRTIIINLNYNLMATLIYSCLITRLLDKRLSVKTTKNHIILHNVISPFVKKVGTPNALYWETYKNVIKMPKRRGTRNI